jgi:hypothetical protein
MGSAASSGAKYELRVQNSSSASSKQLYKKVPASSPGSVSAVAESDIHEIAKLKSRKKSHANLHEGNESATSSLKGGRRASSSVLPSDSDGVSAKLKQGSNLQRVPSRMLTDSSIKNDPERVSTPPTSNQTPHASGLNFKSQQSMSRMSRANSSVSNKAVSSSSTVPWLLKSANLTGTALSEYEMGRVIGMYICSLFLISVVKEFFSCIMCCYFNISLFFRFVVLCRERPDGDRAHHKKQEREVLCAQRCS